MYRDREYNIPEDFRFTKVEMNLVVKVMKLLDDCDDEFLTNQFQEMSTYHLKAVDEPSFHRIYDDEKLGFTDFPRKIMLESIARSMIKNYGNKEVVKFLTRVRNVNKTICWIRRFAVRPAPPILGKQGRNLQVSMWSNKL